MYLRDSRYLSHHHTVNWALSLLQSVSRKMFWPAGKPWISFKTTLLAE